MSYNADITYTVRGVDASTGKVIKLTEAVERLEKRGGPVGESARRAASGIKAMDVATQSALQRLSGSNKAIDPLRMGLASLATQYVQTGAAAARTTTATQNLSRAQMLATTSHQALNTALIGGGLVAAGYVGTLIAMADRYTALQGKINVYATSAANAAAVEEDLFQVAARSRTSVEGVIGLYSRLSPVFTEMGRTQKEASRFTELVSKGLTAQGASAREVEASTVQLAQALASGTLRGDEFRSMMEASPGLMRQIAAGFEGVGGKIGVPTSALKNMAEEGELTSEKVIAAVFRMQNEIENSFSKTKPTVGQSMTVLGDSMTRAIGQQMNNSGSTQAIAASLLKVAEAANEVVAAIGFITNGLVVLGGSIAVGKIAALVNNMQTLSRASVAAGNAINAFGATQQVAAAQAQIAAANNAVFNASTITSATNLTRLQQVTAASVAGNAAFNASNVTAATSLGLVSKAQAALAAQNSIAAASNAAFNASSANSAAGLTRLSQASAATSVSFTGFATKGAYLASALNNVGRSTSDLIPRKVTLAASMGSVASATDGAGRVIGNFNTGLSTTANQLALTSRAVGGFSVAIPPATANVAAMTAAKNSAAAALMGFRTVAGGLVTFLGGPFTIAIMGTIFAWQKYQDMTNQAAAANRVVQEAMKEFEPIVAEYERQMAIAAGSSGKVRDAALEAAGALKEQRIAMYQMQLAETRAQRTKVQNLQVEADWTRGGTGTSITKMIGANLTLPFEEAKLAAADAKLKVKEDELKALGLEILNSDGQVGQIQKPKPTKTIVKGTGGDKAAKQDAAALSASARAAQAAANAEEDANRKLALSLEAVDQWQTAARASAELRYGDNAAAKAQAMAAIETQANAKRTEAQNQFENSVEKAAKADAQAASRDEAAAKRVAARRERELAALEQYRTEAEQAKNESRADLEDDLTTKLNSLALQRDAEIQQARARFVDVGREREAIAAINAEYDAKELTARKAFGEKVAKIQTEIDQDVAAQREKQLAAEAARYDTAAQDAANKQQQAQGTGDFEQAAAWLDEWIRLTRQADDIRAQMDADEIARIKDAVAKRIEGLEKVLGATEEFEDKKARVTANGQEQIDLIEMQARDRRDRRTQEIIDKQEEALKRARQVWYEAGDQAADAFRSAVLSGDFSDLGRSIARTVLEAAYDSLLKDPVREYINTALRKLFRDPQVKATGDMGKSASKASEALAVVAADAKAQAATGGQGGGDTKSSILSFVKSIFGFAQGGVMTSGGPMPLKAYANGGIANSPQLALFGEGRTPEAYVPLPDGRSIPVTMRAPFIDTPAANGNGGRAPSIVNITHVRNIDATGADAAALQRVESKLDALDEGFDRRAVGVVSEAMYNRQVA